jgi:hypothetical protein
MMTIQAEYGGGGSIHGAAMEAVALATRLECWIEFNFNGVICTATVNGDPAKLATDYFAQVRRKTSGVRMAFS